MLTVRLETAYLPPVTFRAGSGGGSEGTGALVALLKPAVTVDLNGTQLYHIAPAGEPGTSRWPWLLGTVVVLVVVVVVFLRRAR